LKVYLEEAQVAGLVLQHSRYKRGRCINV
jgi:hypothetical protein